MKFSIENIRKIEYLVRELATGLIKMDLNENFESFEETITIPATSDYTVRNKLSFIPSKYIIVSQEGNGLVTKKSNTDWTSDFLYLTNNGSVDVTITIIFQR